MCVCYASLLLQASNLKKVNKSIQDYYSSTLNISLEKFPLPAIQPIGEWRVARRNQHTWCIIDSVSNDVFTLLFIWITNCESLVNEFECSYNPQYAYSILLVSLPPLSLSILSCSWAQWPQGTSQTASAAVRHRYSLWTKESKITRFSDNLKSFNLSNSSYATNYWLYDILFV